MCLFFKMLLFFQMLLFFPPKKSNIFGDPTKNIQNIQKYIQKLEGYNIIRINNVESNTPPKIKIKI